MAEAMIQVALETLTHSFKNSSFLPEDAEEKKLTDKALNNWLRKLRDATHLLDDILDKCSTHALSLEYHQDKVQGSSLLSSSYINLTHVKFCYKISKKLKDISQRLDEIAEKG
ncbi:hypothetical protein K1719_046979 [Acacia pycnantha]|nr:hypothetical protein K1719_046979 [Acacia pycnantha]